MSSRSSSSSKSRTDLERERLKRQTKDAKTHLTPLNLYLLAYNILSALLWLNLLIRTISVISIPRSTPQQASSLFSRLLSSSSTSFLPHPVLDLVDRFRNGYDHRDLGWWTKYTQSLAVLEVVHSALGWVRSPLGTTVAQVFSRLWTVWGVVESAPETHSNPLFTSMLFAWSITEVVRYLYYALSILHIDPYWLNYIRYTTFVPLYPLGAYSEAFLSFSTLPPLFTLPYLPSNFFPVSTVLRYLPASVGKAMMRSDFGRGVLWKMARAGVKAKSRGLIGKTWGGLELARLVVFLVWWPSLYVLYAHMFKQRRRVLGTRRRVGVKSKTK